MTLPARLRRFAGELVEQREDLRLAVAAVEHVAGLHDVSVPPIQWPLSSIAPAARSASRAAPTSPCRSPIATTRGVGRTFVRDRRELARRCRRRCRCGAGAGGVGGAELRGGLRSHAAARSAAPVERALVGAVRAACVSVIMRSRCSAAARWAARCTRRRSSASAPKDDAACSRRHPLAPLAIGAHFYPEVSDGDRRDRRRRTCASKARTRHPRGRRRRLVAKQAGTSAVLISTDDGSVVDFVHVWVAPVTQITLARRDGERIAGTVGLAVGEDITLVARRCSNGAQKLAGDADCTWTVSDDTAARRPAPMARPIAAACARARPARRRSPSRSATRTTTIDVEVVP